MDTLGCRDLELIRQVSAGAQVFSVMTSLASSKTFSWRIAVSAYPLSLDVGPCAQTLKEYEHDADSTIDFLCQCRDSWIGMPLCVRQREAVAEGLVYRRW